MKKYYLFLICGIILSSFQLHSQNLKGSTWTGSLPFAPAITMEYALNDTLYFTYPAGRFPWATYTVNGSTVSIKEHDTLTGTCGDTVGVYNYVINADSLVLSAVMETCAGRSFLLETYKWKKVAVSLAEFNLSTSVYPNPFAEKLYTDFPRSVGKITYTISDLSGKIYRSGEIGHQTSAIETGDIPRGVYILHLVKSNQSLRIIKN